MDAECPTPEDLAAYREAGEASPVLEAHLLACPACREALLVLAEARPPVRAFPWRAAAAGLLAVASLAAWGVSGASRSPTAIPRAVALPRFDLVREPGTGRFWVSACGAPVAFDLPGATVVLREGAVAVSQPPRPGFSPLLRDVEAAEDPVRIWSLDGRGEVCSAGKRLALLPARRITLGPVPLSEEAPAAELRTLLLGRALAASGGDAPEGRPGAYRWIVKLEGRSPSTEVGLSFPLSSGWRQWVVGMGSIPASGTEVLEVLWDGRRLSGFLDGRRLLSTDAGGAERFLKPAEGWAVSSWGGRVSVASSRLKPMEAR